MTNKKAENVLTPVSVRCYMCVMPMGKMWIKERERHSDSKAKMSARGKNVIKGANSISTECPKL